MLTHAQNANGKGFRDDTCWVIIDLNGRDNDLHTERNIKINN